VSEFAPVTTLDDGELLEGYRDGRAGEPEPGNNRSRSYWHGWRNGAVDGGHRTKDEAQAVLAAAYARREGAT
jgi:hypothetical protein